MNDQLGPLGRLGRWTAGHVRIVMAAWIVLALGLGVLAPRAEHALSGAGWEATGSESVRARGLIDQSFNGFGTYGPVVVIQAPDRTLADPAFARVLRRVRARLERDPALTTVRPPAISSDRHVAILRAGAARNPRDMVRAAGELQGALAQLGADGVQVKLTGAAAMWSDFNQANKSAMLTSELISWPVTLAILVLAFGSLVAAGLPLMLTIAGLVAAAGSLWIGTRIGDISIWSMNFALMFALALGIDYALFIVYRFRSAFFGSPLSAREAVAATLDTAGKAVLFSGLTVLISLSAVLLVPSPAFRSTSLGIMLSVVFVLAAALTLLPAVLAQLGPRLNRFAVPWVRSREHRSPRSAAWAERLWRRPLRYGVAAVVLLVTLASPILSLKTAMPAGPGAGGPLQIVAPSAQAAQVAAAARRDPGIARVLAPQPGAGGLTLVEAIPVAGAGPAIDRLRAALPGAALVGGPPAESHDLESALAAQTPLVIAVVLGLSFLVLLIAVRAPLIAALGVLTNLLATGAAFGIAKWIFQDGVGHSLLGFAPQGFLDAWSPVFFFAMIFAISMDYTVFLLTSAKEHWNRSGDPKAAMVGGMAQSGRVIFAAGAVMVAVFFTFALSGPLPPKEMGVILGVAVLLDTAVIRLLLLPVLLRLLGRWAWWGSSRRPQQRLEVADRPEVRQLVGVDDPADAGDLAA